MGGINNVKLAGGQTWSVLARLDINSWGTNYVSQMDGSVDRFEADVTQYLKNFYGANCVKSLKVYVTHSYLIDDNVEITFSFTPEHDVFTGDVSFWRGYFNGLSPVFEPPVSLSQVLWRAACRGEPHGPFLPYRQTVWPTPFDYGCYIIEAAEPGDKLFKYSAGGNIVSSLVRSTNDVQTNNPTETGSFALTVASEQRLAQVFSWEIVPLWAKAVLIAAPVLLVGIPTLYVISKAVGAVRGMSK